INVGSTPQSSVLSHSAGGRRSAKKTRRTATAADNQCRTLPSRPTMPRFSLSFVGHRKFIRLLFARLSLARRFQTPAVDVAIRRQMAFRRTAAEIVALPTLLRCIRIAIAQAVQELIPAVAPCAVLPR